MRGEYSSPMFGGGQLMGSPPLAWGIPVWQFLLDAGDRITPTCVGNTEFWWCLGQIRQDHPHLRGEYPVRSLSGLPALGSPPLAWGIQTRLSFANFSTRITPTCVGNTSRPRHKRKRPRDHPHLRGEYPFSLFREYVKAGSPPLAWGILYESLPRSNCPGITPTCVGNTQDPAAEALAARDHPHLRGEYPARPLSTTATWGSPPLAWGIPWLEFRTLINYRITPTCVGNTNPHGR